MRIDPSVDTRSKKFGLRCGQTYDGENLFYPRSVWCDEKGRLVGWGDLSIADVETIEQRLRGDEYLIVVSNGSRDWRENEMVDVRELLGDAPFVIGSSERYFVSKFKDNLKNPMDAGLNFEVLTPVEAEALFLHAECP